MITVSICDRKTYSTVNNASIDSSPAINDSEIDDTSDHSERIRLREPSDDERVPYTLNVPQNGSNSGTIPQRRKRKRRSPYSLIVRLGYDGCDRVNRDEIPVSAVPEMVK